MSTPPLHEAVALTRQLEQTDIYDVLVHRPRYGAFKPALMTVEAWEQLLDCDVNNMRHNLLTAGLGHIICQQEGASEAVTRNVVMTATVHDIPEFETGNDKTGDIPHGLVEQSDEEAEDIFLLRLGENPAYPITSEIAKIAVATMADSKAEQRQTEEGELFRLAERLGYMRTAIIAHDAYRQLPRQEKDLRETLLVMWADIFGNSYATLAAQYDQFNSVRNFFDDSFDQLDEMFDAWISSKGASYEFYTTRQISGRRYDVDKEFKKIMNAHEAHKALKDRLRKS